MAKKKTTTLKQKIALVAGSIIFTVILLELALRLGGFIVLSIRDRANRIDLSRKDEYRVLCVGESTTYCGDRSYAYPRQLQTILNERVPGKSFTVINKGKPGCSTAYIVSQMEGWIEKYRPDMIVAMMGINDTAASHREHEKVGGSRRWVEDLRVYKVVALLRRNIRDRLEKIGLASPRRPKADLFHQKGYLGDKYDLYYREDDLLSALRRDPGDIKAYIQLGNCYLGQDRYEEAVKAFEKAIALDPESDEAYVGLGRDFLNKQSHKAAKNACLKALEINPENDEALTVLGQSCMAKKRYGEATDAFKKAIEINPDNDLALSSLAWIYFWKYKHPEEGKEFAFRALEINPANYLANLTLWKCYQKEGDYPAAIDVCKKVIEVDPYNQRAYLELAFLYRETGRPELAEKYRRKEQSLQMTTYNPITYNSYQQLREIADRHGIQLIAVQYPIRSILPLERMLAEHDDIIFVDNEAVFKDALSRSEYDAIFKDKFAGDFGHCTAEGNRLLADNIVTMLIDEYFQSD